jgi:hypothetical protein
MALLLTRLHPQYKACKFNLQRRHIIIVNESQSALRIFWSNIPFNLAVVNASFNWLYSWTNRCSVNKFHTLLAVHIVYFYCWSYKDYIIDGISEKENCNSMFWHFPIHLYFISCPKCLLQWKTWEMFGLLFDRGWVFVSSQLILGARCSLQCARVHSAYIKKLISELGSLERLRRTGRSFFWPSRRIVTLSVTLWDIIYVNYSIFPRVF